jgi:galactokinase
MGKEDHALRLDCRSLEYEYIPLRLQSYKILLLNTNVKHSLAASAYNTRRNECAGALSLVQQHHPELRSLRDVTEQMLRQYVLPLNKILYQRASYVVQENQRLQQACDCLKQSELAALGQLMLLTHEGLSKQYEVSCDQLDWLVDQVRNEPAVLGARLMGGGFGGCTINLVREDAVTPLLEKLKPAYQKAFGLPLDHYLAGIAPGVSLVTQ